MPPNAAISVIHCCPSLPGTFPLNESPSPLTSDGASLAPAPSPSPVTAALIAVDSCLVLSSPAVSATVWEARCWLVCSLLGSPPCTAPRLDETPPSTSSVLLATCGREGFRLQSLKLLSVISQNRDANADWGAVRMRAHSRSGNWRDGARRRRGDGRECQRCRSPAHSHTRHTPRACSQSHHAAAPAEIRTASCAAALQAAFGEQHGTRMAMAAHPSGCMRTKQSLELRRPLVP